MQKLSLVMLALALVVATDAYGRNQIRVVGSSTVFPFATAVAEDFGRSSSFKTPIIESTGSGGGMKLFCTAIGLRHPDVTNASRRIKRSEYQKCKKAGIDIIEVKFGFDGIVLANAKGWGGLNMVLSLRDIYLALAKKVPAPNCSKKSCGFIDNPYTSWQEVNASLPDIRIEVLGPPPTSGTRDAFVELAMEGGAKSFPYLAALRKRDKAAFKVLSHAIREDGVWIDSGENDNLMVHKLTANKKAVGIMGFSFLDQNGRKIKGLEVNNVAPSFENIADGKYSISRSLYFYVKKNHIGVIPGLAEYLYAFTSDKAWGEEGFLLDKGLIPLPDRERGNIAREVRRGKELEM